MCSQPDDAEQQQTDQDESVCEPIDAAMLPIQRHRADRTKPMLLVKRQSGNEKQDSADYACSQCKTIQFAYIGGLQSRNKWQQYAPQRRHA